MRLARNALQNIVNPRFGRGGENQRRVGGERKTLARNAERDRVCNRLRLAQRDFVGKRKCLCRDLFVFLAENRTEPVGEDKHAQSAPLCHAHDRSVIEERARGGRVLQEVAAAADEQLCTAHLAQNGGDIEAPDRAHAVFSAAPLGIFAEEGDRQLGRAAAQPRKQRGGNRIVARVAEAVVAADENFAADVGRDGGQAFVHCFIVARRPRGGVVLENHAAAVCAERFAVARLKECADVGKELCLGGVAAVAAAVVRPRGFCARAFVENADIALVARDNRRNGAAHRFKRGARSADKNITRCDKGGRVGAQTGGENDSSPVLFLQLVGNAAHVGEQILLGGEHAVADNHDFKVGIFFEQSRRAFRKAELRPAAALVHAADRDDAVLRVAKPKLLCNAVPCGVGGKTLGVDAVDRDRNIVRKDAVVVNEVLLDVLADRHLAVAPVGELFPERRDGKDPVRGGDKAEVQLLLQFSADERGNACVRVDDVKMLCLNQFFQPEVAAQHLHGIFRVQRQRHMANAVCLEHFGIFAARRRDRNAVSVARQRTGQFVDMRLRAAEAHLHGRHQNIQFLAARLFHTASEFCIFCRHFSRFLPYNQGYRAILSKFALIFSKNTCILAEDVVNYQGRMIRRKRVACHSFFIVNE